MELIFGVIIFTLILFSHTGFWKKISLRNKWVNIVFLVLILVSGITVFLIIFEQFKYTFSYFCQNCPVYGQGVKVNQPVSEYLKYFFEGVFFYFITIIPMIIFFSYVSALLQKFKIKSIKNPIVAFILAGILPICACGVFPLIYSLDNKNKMETISKLVFFITTPLLSPVIIALALTQLGGEYLIWRVIFTATFVTVSAGILYLFILIKKDDEKRPVFKCAQMELDSTKNILDFTAELCMDLFPAVGLGIIIGTLTVVLVPADFINVFLDRPNLALILFSVSGIPIYFCGGSDILILTPLVEMGLPIHFSYAFSMTGAGICFGSIPLLFKTFKWKFAMYLIILFIIIPPVLALVFNLFLPEITLIDKGF